MNSAVFYWDVMDEKENALTTAKQAVEVGMKTIEKVDNEDDKEDALRLLEMLRENIEIWEDAIEEIEK